jgi:hypothetical protein
MDVSISFFFCGRSVRCLFDGVDYGVESKRVHRAHRSFFGKRDHHFIAEKHYSMMGKAFGYAHLLQSCWFRATSTCDECLMRVGVDFAQGPAAFVVSMLFASKTNDFSSTTRYNSKYKNNTVALHYPYSTVVLPWNSRV